MNLNHKAALVGALPADLLHWRVITSGVDPGEGTMFTLFGNDAAVGYSRNSAAGRYPKGCVLALATWRQQENGRWFGARIPAEVKSVEFVEVKPGDGGSLGYGYRVYEGSPLREAQEGARPLDERVGYILSLRAAVMP